MTHDEVEYFRQAEQYANSGQTTIAHQMFRSLRDHGNTEVEIFFWIATTSSSSIEMKRAIDTVRRIQPYHPRLPELVAFYAKKQRYVKIIRIGCLLYLCAIAFIIVRDIPRGTVNTLNTIVIIYVVLFNMALVANIVRLALSRRVFTAFSALYIAALIGFFMTTLTSTPTGVPLVVFGVVLLYVCVHTVVLAMCGVLAGRVFN
jgi:hypothetical protein